MHWRSIPLWSLECRLPSGQYTDTIILGRHGENALNEYSPLVVQPPCQFIACLNSRFLFSVLRTRSSRTSGIGSSMREQSRVNLQLHGMAVHIVAGCLSVGIGKVD